MTFGLYDILEPQVEPCEGCGEGVDLDAFDTYNSTPYNSVVCLACEDRQIAFEDAVEEVEV